MQTRRDHAYGQLRTRLADGRLRPGDRLGEVALAAELEVSRGPLREAINQLASEGLVDRTPGIGAFVSQPSPEEIREIYEIRGALESFGAARAANRLAGWTVGHLAAVVESMDTLVESARERESWSAEDRERLLDLDHEFHGIIEDAADNRRLSKLLDDHLLLRRVLAYDETPRSASTPETRREAVRQHRAILMAIQERDPDAAASAMRRHVKTACRNALAALSRGTASGGAASA